MMVRITVYNDVTGYIERIPGASGDFVFKNQKELMELIENEITFSITEEEK